MAGSHSPCASLSCGCHLLSSGYTPSIGVDVERRDTWPSETSRIGHPSNVFFPTLVGTFLQAFTDQLLLAMSASVSINQRVAYMGKCEPTRAVEVVHRHGHLELFRPSLNIGQNGSHELYTALGNRVASCTRIDRPRFLMRASRS